MTQDEAIKKNKNLAVWATNPNVEPHEIVEKAESIICEIYADFNQEIYKRTKEISLMQDKINLLEALYEQHGINLY